MDRLENAKKIYNELLENNQNNCIIYTYIIDCLEEAKKSFNLKLTSKQNDELITTIHDYYLDTDIQISKICDVLVENYKNIYDDDFSIYDYIDNLF